jgi:hypothetical protein
MKHLSTITDPIHKYVALMNLHADDIELFVDVAVAYTDIVQPLVYTPVVRRPLPPPTSLPPSPAPGASCAAPMRRPSGAGVSAPAMRSPCLCAVLAASPRALARVWLRGLLGVREGCRWGRRARCTPPCTSPARACSSPSTTWDGWSPSCGPGPLPTCTQAAPPPPHTHSSCGAHTPPVLRWAGAVRGGPVPYLVSPTNRLTPRLPPGLL